MVDAGDLKSSRRMAVRVRIPAPAPFAMQGDSPGEPPCIAETNWGSSQKYQAKIQIPEVGPRIRRSVPGAFYV